ncbi:P-loop containing nucleoside triphosphate hydrolase protein [Chaetomidium leptoderma]|uniref:P-loop containing nucleoside triphosphate hydrolase protein n=1 Tax=Chaetomidium leptoderma TaxID=669021 RepID=A0AAN6VRN6_9PEZI|nr:P-loop containing nucleoside triphosphate hydrolase protein [Chaetomidium leptoderma]
MTRVKQEPGSARPNVGSRLMATPDSIADAQSETPSEQVQRRRHIRSAAPSVDTRARPPSAPGLPAIQDDDEDDDCLIMQVRRNPKAEDDTNLLGSQSIQGSFIGANRSLRNIGQKLKDINDALGELQARGIQHVASLPELVLVGDQSSGKSSLMSAIAGLSVPRSSGTCTRCPIHIRVSRADEWSCRVFLKQDYDFCPPDHPLTERDVTGANKFPPWVKLDPSRQVRREFKTVRDQFDADEIETVLRCAQVAILNPSTPYQFFIPKLKGEAPDSTREQLLEQVKRKEERAEAQFSPNTVALEVKGPDLADLNFYDLPGVFMTARRAEDTFLERVVQNLTKEYISRQSAIILCAVPMNQDTENSLALKIIRGQRAENRCVGIMTKADLLPKEEHAAVNWLAMLHGEAHSTGFGYFITSRQGSDLEEQNKMEEAFFNRTADATGQWPEVFDDFKEKFGVEKLKSFLSLKLGEEFAKILPEVKEKVNSRLHDIGKQLKKYPDPPPNPELEVMKSLAEFTIRVKDRVLHQDFMSIWDGRFGEPFKKFILAMKPKFNVRDHAKAAKPAYIDLDGDSPTTSPTMRKRPAPVSGLTQSTPKRQRGQQLIKTETPDHPMFPATPSHARSVTPAGTPSRGSRSKSLMDIRNLIRRAAIPGQPGLVSASVYEPLYTEAAKTWAPHLEWFINNTFAFLQAEVFAILDTAFAHLKNRAVYKESLEHMRAFIETQKTELRAQLHLIYNLEAQRLFTKDDDSLKRNQAAEMTILVRHRNHFRIAAHSGEELHTVPKVDDMTDEERKQEESKMAKDLKNLGPDPFEPELAVAAYIRGYYLTAANRFVDYVSIHVMSGLLPRVASVIETYLHEALGLSSGRVTALEVLRRLMSEGPEIEQKRSDLRAEKETLDGAMDIIVNLERREREQQAAAAAAAAVSASSQYGSGFDASQAEGMASFDAAGHLVNGVAGDRGTVYSATAFGDA